MKKLIKLISLALIPLLLSFSVGVKNTYALDDTLYVDTMPIVTGIYVFNEAPFSSNKIFYFVFNDYDYSITTTNITLTDNGTNTINILIHQLNLYLEDKWINTVAEWLIEDEDYFSVKMFSTIYCQDVCDIEFVDITHKPKIFNLTEYFNTETSADLVSASFDNGQINYNKNRDYFNGNELIDNLDIYIKTLSSITLSLRNEIASLEYAPSEYFLYEFGKWITPVIAIVIFGGGLFMFFTRKRSDRYHE